ncbi:hypothetical protein GCM10018773_24040 [Streptomyces candidus]|nr:hypothetical protein GCM10018773_24040 [Streptomyces candidus]
MRRGQRWRAVTATAPGAGGPAAEGREPLCHDARGTAPGRAYRGPYFRPVFDVIPPSSPRGATFTTPISAL